MPERNVLGQSVISKFAALAVALGLLWAFPLLSCAWGADSPVVINEIFVDGSSNYTDWIELYNKGDKPVSLKGYVLTDNLEERRWVIPVDFIIKPGGFKLFYCDNGGFHDHAGFGLDSISGEVGLFRPDGGLADSLVYDDLPRFSSLGRWPDGTGEFFVHDDPTRGSANPEGLNPMRSTREAPISFSRPSGRYDTPFDLILTAPEGMRIRYTMDGSLPDAKSPLYDAPLRIEETAVLRASAVSPEGRAHAVFTRSYILNERTRLPVVSVVSDPKNLWDREVGIYAEGFTDKEGVGTSQNWRHNWRRPVHLDFLAETGDWQVDGKMRIYGGASRARPQKSFVIYATSQEEPYGIRHRLFPGNPRDAYAGIILRNGGDAWLRTGIRDAFQQEMVRGRVACDTLDYRPVIAYLNGRYWGIYGMREHMSRKNLLARHGLPVQPVDVMDGGREVGSEKGPFADMPAVPVEGDYRPTLEALDIDAFLDYLAVELYSGNPDWPDGNIKCWRPKSKAIKWQWILFDLDRGFDGKRGKSVDEDPFDILYRRRGGEGLMFRELAKNPGFVQDICARLAVHMLTTFAPERGLAILDRIAGDLRPEMERHFDRWRWSWNFERLFMSMNRWDAYLDQLRDYCRERPQAMLNILDKRFGVGTAQNIRIRIARQGRGRILAENVPLDDGRLEGPVPRSLVIHVSVEPEPGFVFKGWRDHPESGPQISVRAGQTFIDTAIFEPDNKQREKE
jgi:hypothetical protein